MAATDRNQGPRRGSRSWLTPAVICCAVISLISVLIAAWMNNRANAQLERSKAADAERLERAKDEESLILWYVQNGRGDPDRICSGLLFAITLGQVHDDQGTIRGRCGSASASAPQPVADWHRQMNVKVARSDLETQYQLQVDFTVPTPPNLPSYKFDIITVYVT